MKVDVLWLSRYETKWVISIQRWWMAVDYKIIGLRCYFPQNQKTATWEEITSFQEFFSTPGHFWETHWLGN